MAACGDKVTVEWKPPPPEVMYDMETYEVAWKILVNEDEMPIIRKGDDNHIPHANIHSCLRSGGACTPFVSNSPGLSTHTPALKSDITVVDGIQQQTFTTNVELETKQYTIIAHTRFFTPSTIEGLPPSKIDVAVGVVRDVVVPQAAVSSGAIVQAIVIGGLLLAIIVSVVGAARSGKLDFEKLIEAILDERVVMVLALFNGYGDVIAFTMTVLNTVESGSSKLYEVLPLMILFCGTSWIVSIVKSVHDLLLFIEINKTTGSSEVSKTAASTKCANLTSKYLQEPAKKKSQEPAPVEDPVTEEGPTEEATASQTAAGLKRTITRKVSTDDRAHQAAMDYAKAERNVKKLWFSLVAVALEAGPLMGLSIYILINSETVQLTDTLTLFFSSMFLGNAFTSLSGFKSTRYRRDKALCEFAQAIGDANLRQAIEKRMAASGSKSAKIAPLSA